MKKLFSYLGISMFMCFAGNSLQAQQKIGGTPGAVNPSAILELESTSRGLLLPRLTTAQRNAINLGSQTAPPNGLVIYNTDIDCVEYWNGKLWKSLCDGSSSGNALVATLDCGNPRYAGNAPIAGSIVTGFNVGIDYTGGNGGNYGSMQIASTDVEGLTATISGDTLSNSGGTLNFTITGTAKSPGTAKFPLVFGGQNCSFNVPVAPPAAVASVTGCGSVLTPSKTITAGTAVPDGTTVSLPYTGGNGGSYSPINVSSAGVSGLFAGAVQGTINNGNGNLILTLTGTPAAGPGGTATFNIPFAGNTCQIQVPVAPGGGSISGFSNCPGTASGTLKEGTSYTTASNVTITLNYSGGNGGVHQAVNQPSSGVSGLFAQLDAGNFASGAGTLTFHITGTPSGNGTASFSISLGGQTCVLQIPVQSSGITPIPGNVALTAGQKYFIASVADNNYLPYTAPTGPATTTPSAPDGTTETPVIVQGTLTTTGVTIQIPYVVTGSSANLPAYSQTVNVPASLSQDGIARDVTLSYPAQTLAVGKGYITATLQSVSNTLNVKQLDINTGIGNDNQGILLAEFTIATDGFGGTGKVQLRAIAGLVDRNFADVNHRFLYLPVTSSSGKIWQNNNLGADYANLNNASFNPAQQATASTDYHAYGSYFQWGRLSDGHELATWSGSGVLTVTTTTPTPSTGDVPGHALFIRGYSSSAWDWRSTNNSNLWQPGTGLNNPCPIGFRVPTQAEWKAEIQASGITSALTAYNSPLRLTLAGTRYDLSGLAQYQNTEGFYWTSTRNTNSTSFHLRFNSSPYVSADNANYGRAGGFPVRCIQE